MISYHLIIFVFTAPRSIRLLIPKLIKDKEEIEIKCLFSNDSNPKPNKVKFQVGDKSYFRKKVCYYQLLNLNLNICLVWFN